MNKNNSGLLQGLIAGLVVLVVSIIIYAISPMWFLKLWYIKIFIIIAFMVYSLYLFKKANNDELPFQGGLRNSYLVWIVAFLMWFAFKFSLFNFIDPGLSKVKEQLDMQFVQTMGPADQKAQAENNLSNQEKHENRNFFLEMGTTLIIGFFYALVIAGAYSITNKKPEPDLSGADDETELNS